jgi:preprotein translocase subunit Sss1
MITTFAKILGVVLIVIGALGFVPGLARDGLLFGIFRIDPFHNLIHLVTGIMVAAAGFADNWDASRRVLLIVAAFYGIITIVGFLSSTGMVFGMPMNMADDVLHLAITVVALLVALPRRYAMPR